MSLDAWCVAHDNTAPEASSPGDWYNKGPSTQWPRWHRNEIFASCTCEIGGGQPKKLLLRHQGVITPEYLLKSCVIVSGVLARLLNAHIEALSWQSSGVLQGSIGWQQALVGVHGIADRFSSLMSPGFDYLTVMGGSEYGIAEVNTLPMPVLLNRTVRMAGVWWFGVGYTVGRGLHLSCLMALRGRGDPTWSNLGWLFQQDNAHPHTARLTQEFLRANAVHKLPWPVYSPNLSPIEHLWDLIDRRIRPRDPPPKTIPQLCLSIKEVRYDILRQGLHIWSLQCHGDAEQCMRHEVVTPVIDPNAFKGPLHRGHWHNKLLYCK